MLLPQFQYVAPATTEALMALLSQHREKARILSGGTDLLILMQDRVVKPDWLIDISGLRSLHGISYEEGRGLVIGAAAKIEAVEGNRAVRENYVALYQAARALGSPQVRAMGSIGGNSCNASPAADTPPALMVFGARVSLVSERGQREMSLEDFIRGNRQTVLEADEYLESFFLEEPWPCSASRYAYLTLREAMEIPMVGVAVNLSLDPSTRRVERVRIVMGAVAPTPLRARRGEELLLGKIADDRLMKKAAEACAAESKPIDDFRASLVYRREIVRVLVFRTLRETITAIA